jgi:hypothetical protein
MMHLFFPSQNDRVKSQIDKLVWLRRYMIVPEDLAFFAGLQKKKQECVIHSCPFHG